MTKVPESIKKIVDEAAGKEHSADGAVMRCLEQVLRVHAHELAEEIRRLEPDWDGDEDPWIVWNGAADLIDPEVS